MLALHAMSETYCVREGDWGGCSSRMAALAWAMTADENPYAAPRDVDLGAAIPRLADDGGVWQDGHLLVVVARGSNMPARCVKCNAPTDYRLKRKLMWHSPWFYLLLLAGLPFCLAGLVLYIVVAMLVRHTAVVYPGLCNVHRRQRRRAIWIAWLFVLAAPLLWWLAATYENNDGERQAILSVLGLMFCFGGAIYGVLRSSVLTPKKIEAQFAWLKGASPQFLSELPVSPVVR